MTEREVTMSICEWLCRDRESTSWEIIIAKIILSVFSIVIVYICISPIAKFIGAVDVKEKILRLTVIGWFLTSVRIWWFNRTARRLSHSNIEFLKKVQGWGRRSYKDLIPIYILNYPILILSIYFIVTKIFPLLFGQELSITQMGIFAFILGYAIDGIWELFKRFPEIFARR